MSSSTQHSVLMAKMGEMSHQLPGGPSLGERVTEAGFEWRSIAENIAAKVSDVDDVMQAWMNSPGISSLHLILGHRQNILGSFEYFGAAQVSQFWTQDFATSSNQGTTNECM